MLKSLLLDGEGAGRTAGITRDHAVKVTVLDPVSIELPVETLTRRKVIFEYLSNNSNYDLNVDGSTPIDFTVDAELLKVKWITKLRVILNGVNLEIDTNDFRRFGAATASQTPLTNGIKLFVRQGGVNSNLYVEPIKTIGEFLYYSDNFVNLPNSVGTQEDYLYFDFIFEVPVVLPEGTQDKIVMTIQDDLTDIDFFRVIARGYQELKT
jgi:hypothetical protein